MEELQKYKQILELQIKKFFEENLITTKKEDIFLYEHLKEFCLRGKMVRGCIVIAVNEALTKKISKEAVIAGACLEILHSSILIVDDIIDKDDIRRGKPAMHILLKDFVKNSLDIEHDSKSVALCVSLIGTYLSYYKLSELNPNILKQISETFIKTSFAEANEIIICLKEKVSEEEILNIYKFKTAKYTITLPFKIGYIISNSSFTEELEEITDNIGMIFQIKDDLLEIEHSSESIGKSDSSDIKARKKHYPRILLEKYASKKDLELINKCYDILDEKSIKTIKEKYKKYNIVEKTKEIIKKLEDQIIFKIENQNCKNENPNVKWLLKKILNYVSNRNY